MQQNGTVSKGITALRRSTMRPERITVDGEMFYFRKLTIAQEEELDALIKANQRTDLIPPKEPEKDATVDQIRTYTEEVLAHRQETAKAFRKMTAEIMKFILCDETNSPFFSPEDDVLADLDNVYAEKFLKAYTTFRNGSEASAGGAEGRFPK